MSNDNTPPETVVDAVPEAMETPIENEGAEQEEETPVVSIDPDKRIMERPKYKRRPPVITKKLSYGLALPGGERMPCTPKVHLRLNHRDRMKYEAYGVPAPLFKPVTFDVGENMGDLHVKTLSAEFDVRRESQMITAHRILRPEHIRPQMFVLQSHDRVAFMKQLVLCGLHRKKITSHWIKVSEFTRDEPVIPEGCSAVVLHNISDQDQYRKVERVRDILCECSDKMVFILTEGPQGASHFMRYFGKPIDGGYLCLQRNTITVDL